MAETEKRKKPATSKTNTGKSAGGKSSAAKTTASGTTAAKAKSTGAASKSRTVTATAASSKPSASSSRSKTATAAAKKPTKKKNQKPKEIDEAQMEAKIRRKSTFTQQFLPYILVAIAIFLGACFILDAIGDAKTPGDHMMGYVGYYICQVLFGCLGGAAYMIPLLLINLVIFWKKCYEEGFLLIKVLLSVALMLIISAVIHVFACNGNSEMAKMIAPAYLYNNGAQCTGGGVLGGLLGYVLFLGLKLPGTIILSVLVIPLLLMCLIGVTPSFVFTKLGRAIKTQWQKAAEERALREEEAAAEEEEDDEEEEAKRKAATAEKYRERRAKVNAKADKERAKKNAVADKDEEPDESDEDDLQEVAAAETAEAATEEPAEEQENLVVDPRTGEILGTDGGKSKKGLFHRGKKAQEEPADEPWDEDESDEPAGLPFYDTPGATDGDDDEEEASLVAAEAAESLGKHGHGRHAKSKRGLREEPASSPVDDGYADDDDEADTMEVGYDDDFADDDEPGVNYEVVIDDGEASPKKTSRKKNDPYATVRILKSETAAVAEAGLSEEEVVISSAHTVDAPAEDAAEEEEAAPAREYVFPPVDLLIKGSSRYEANEAEIAENTQVLREVLESFHIRVKEISCSCGPTITRFEVKPDSGVRVRSIANLVDDIAMGLAKAGVRIEAPIPGKAAVGIEVPNAEPATVYFRNILETPEFRNHKSRIASCLGADVSGRPVILDINKMPHLLVAGTTGSGKSVCINSIIMSILYKAKPDEVKLILIDPKKVEFAVYRDLPHLYCPIISDPKKAAGALNSAVNEMERRFELIEEVGVRNLAGYNEVTADDPARPPMPQMVIIIDELADLMMTASNEVETAICRLAQKARAAGIHLILGTQRPSTDVITGLIKANVPSRIAFTVTQSVDSRIIIDSVGAEKLIGRGDMLYSPVGTTKPLRVQGTFVSDSEVERVVTFLRENNEKGEFDESFTRQIEIEAAKCAAGKKKGEQMSIEDFDGLGGDGGRKDNEDPKFWEALDVAAGKDKIGTSALQRALNLGYGRAAKIIDRMEELGFVGPDPGTKQGRKVLITKQQLMEYRANGLPSSGGGGDDGDEGDFDDL